MITFNIKLSLTSNPNPLLGEGCIRLLTVLHLSKSICLGGFANRIQDQRLMALAPSVVGEG